MKRLIVCLLSFLFLCGCGNRSASEEVTDPYEDMDTADQTRHYRPVHLKEDWTIARNAKRLTLRTGQDRIQLGVRYDPEAIVIRNHGIPYGRVAKLDDGFVSAWFDENPNEKLRLSCEIAHETTITWKDKKYIYYYDENNRAWSSTLEVRKLQPRRLYSVAGKSDGDRKDVCEGVDIESPFSAFGLLLFHEDEIPLALRMGMAWYVTVFGSECAGHFSN